MKNFWNRAFTLVGRTGVALFALILFIHGSTKNATNVNNDAELEVLGDVMSVADEFELSERLLAADEGVASTADLEEITVECVPDDTATNEDSGATVSAAEIAQGWRVVSVATNDVASYEMPMNAIEYRPWVVRGGFQDRFWLDFGDWSFPLGSNEYSRVVISTWGEIWSEWNEEEKKIAAVGVPMAAVPGVSVFGWAEGENDSRILTWKDFALNRDTNALVSAQMVLKPNGDFLLYSNNVVRTCSRVEAFDWDGDGIANVDDANPMRWDGNYLGQTEEQKEFVALSVGSGLENGYYRFRATFPSAPTRRTLLTVGTNHVVVTDAGDYDFLLEKGIEYTFGTEPVNTNVIYTAVDDVPSENENGLMLAANDYWYSSGYWTIGGGWLRLIYPTEYYFGRIIWLPKLAGSPDLPHFWPGNDSVVLVANLDDCLNSSCATYEWSANGGVTFSSPNSPVTRATVTSFPIWDEHLTFKVTATIGTNVLVSTATTSWGKTENEPSFGFSFSAATTGGIILFEDEYENAPGETVERASTFQEVNLSCSSGRETTDIEMKLESGAGLIALHEDSTNGPTVSLPWRTSLEKYESLTKKFYAEALAASSSENDICLKASARNGTSAYTEEAKFTAIRLIVHPQKKAPENACKYRHMIGVNELVDLTQTPSAPHVTWNISGEYGEIISAGNPQVILTPLVATNAKFTAMCRDAVYTPAIIFVEPSIIETYNPIATNTTSIKDGEAGGLLLSQDIFIGPMTVSFEDLYIQEEPCYNVIEPEGYFDDIRNTIALSHTRNAGAGPWFPLRKNHYWATDEAAILKPYPRIDDNGNITTNTAYGWRPGFMTWRIPIVWSRDGEGGICPSYPFADERLQEFMIQSDGTVGIRKFLNTATRTTNNVIRLNGRIVNSSNGGQQ